MGFIRNLKEKNEEIECYLRFLEIQRKKKNGEEVQETKKEMAYRRYLTDLVEVDKPKKNPIGFM